MRFRRRYLAGLITFFIILLSACVPQPSGSENSGGSVLQQAGDATKTPFQPSQISVYMSQGVPEGWQSAIKAIPSVQIVTDADNAALSFAPQTDNDGINSLYQSKLVFAAAVPFMTVDDDFSIEELQELWRGTPVDGQYTTLFVSNQTLGILNDAWGPNSSNVKAKDRDSLLPSVEATEGAVAILSFDEITPRWKILKINGMSPLDKPLDESKYPLIFTYALIDKSNGNSLAANAAESMIKIIPQTNRDEAKMTVVVMSGTTAMARCTAAKILLKGIDYPIEAVKNWFLSADLRHVSNEVSFVRDCPRTNTCSTTLQLCAHPESVEVLEKLGINVVELTGNHENDYGSEDFAYTLGLYQEKGFSTYGGGFTIDEAKKPLLIENNGNKIAFIGCNPVGPATAWVKGDAPGVAQCDFEYLDATIKELKAQGYVVISTFQDNEVYEFMYSELYRENFRAAVQSGADIVQGSQAHYPMGFEFIDDSIIHYGLGNFLFDQMDIPVVGTKREFIDRHILYDGKYINTELLTALLTDWARPVPMTESDRAQFLTDIFEASKKRWP